MKQTYENPKMEIIHLMSTDVITTSGIDGDQNLSGSTPEEDG